MTQIFEYVRIALMNIRSNKGRSFLTMLGIIIGISSVILIITVGNGVKSSLNSGLNDMIGNQIYFSFEDMTNQGREMSLSLQDFEEIKAEIPGIKTIYSGGGSFNSQIHGKEGDKDVSITFGTPGYFYASKEKMVKGRYYDANDFYSANHVCVIDEKSARNLFGHDDVLGMTINTTFWGSQVSLQIIGVRKSTEQSGIMAYLEMLDDFDSDREIKLEAPESVLYSLLIGYFDVNLLEFDNFVVIADSADSQDRVAGDVLDYCERKFECQGQNKIHVQNFGEMMSEMNKMMDYITLFVVLVAAISLIVGGIGVMNIMLVSVTERTREIGIRKALGARTGSILIQFLSESAIITLLGGVIGIVIGIAGAYGICALVGFSAKVSIASVVGASGFSAGVGLFFGIYPARKAAKLSPIEALRHE